MTTEKKRCVVVWTGTLRDNGWPYRVVVDRSDGEPFVEIERTDALGDVCWIRETDCTMRDEAIRKALVQLVAFVKKSAEGAT